MLPLVYATVHSNTTVKYESKYTPFKYCSPITESITHFAQSDCTEPELCRGFKQHKGSLCPCLKHSKIATSFKKCT